MIYVELQKFRNRAEAELLLGRLQSAGIDCRIRAIDSVQPQVNFVENIVVDVLADQLEKARDIIC